MIAACPKCAARFRIERERLQAGAVRLRCSRCEAVFRVRPPEEPEAPPPPPAPRTPAEPAPLAAPAREVPAPVAAPSPAPSAPRSGDHVLVAMSNAELATRTARLLAERGYHVSRVADGVEAMLEIQRKLPRAVVLAADLPKMFGFQICEIVKRNPSLSGTWVVLVGAIHNPDRYRREASDLYGADAYLEGPTVPEGLLPLLEQGGLAARRPAPASAAAAPAPLPAPARPEPPRPEPAPVAVRPPLAAPPRPGAVAPPRPAAAAPPPRPALPPAPAPRARPDDGLEQERAKAERLARIVVSDIVLYNEERFSAAARAGNVLTAMAADLAEGRALFDERIDARVRSERDHLKEELLRSAKLRGMR